MTRRERLRDENDPGDRQFRESGSDGRIRSCISRVGKRFAQVRSSSLSFFLSSTSSCFFVSLTLFFSVRKFSLFRSFVLSIPLARIFRRSWRLVRSTKTKEATGPAPRGKKKETNEGQARKEGSKRRNASRGKEISSVAGGTKTEAEKRGEEGGGTQQQKKEKQREEQQELP